MTMQLKTFFAQDRSGNVIPNATVRVFLANTETLASIFDIAGVSKSNPFNTGETGQVQFRVANGEYDVRIVTGEGDYTQRVEAFDFDEAEIETDSGTQTVPEAVDFRVIRGQVGAESVTTSTGTQTVSEAFNQRANVADLGDAASRGVVGGSGDLMAQGAFGLGRTNLDTLNDANLDTFLTTGYYYIGLNAVNGPSSGGFYLNVVGSKGGTNNVSQFAHSLGTSRSWTRTGFSGSWTEWSPVYTGRTILGTVSLSGDGSIPTGAIIERGSNANGEYTKFADGTLICRRYVDFDGEDGTVQQFNLPHSFSNINVASSTSLVIEASSSGEALSFVGGLEGGCHRSSSIGWRYRSKTPQSPANVPVALFAIGRWY